jgi:hypothetical protein
MRARKDWKKSVIKYLEFMKKNKILLTLRLEVQYKKFHIRQGNLRLSKTERAARRAEIIRLCAREASGSSRVI